jgi:undecaprenyl-diphosphatase
MALYRVRPTSIDQAISEEIAANSQRLPEKMAELLTWGADEHVLLGCAAAAWIAAGVRGSRLQPTAGHVLLVTAASAVLPHVLKSVFDQVRPDRKTVRGHLHGIPLSGDAMDAFPSGHALHMGALASAATVLPGRYRFAAWTAALSLSGTRVVVLAHWLSDVVAGFVIGVALERSVRRLTGYPDRFLRGLVSTRHGL